MIRGKGVKRAAFVYLSAQDSFLQSLSRSSHSPHLPQRPATSRYPYPKPSECRSHLAGVPGQQELLAFTL